MKTYGYIRVSTQRQDPQRQITNILRQNADAVLFSDKYTGTSLHRPEFQRMMSQVEKDLKAGESVTIIFDEVSRMSRDAVEGFALYQELYGKGVELQFIKEPYLDTESYRNAQNGAVNVRVESGDADADDLLSSIINAVNKFIQSKVKSDIEQAFKSAQAEVERLHIRTSEGMRSSGATNTVDADGNVISYGKIAESKMGSHPIHKKSARAAEIIKKHSKDFGGSLNDEEVRQLCGVARNTYYRIKKELKSN